MTVLEQVDAFLASLGLNPAARAGAEGNLSVESGLSPTAYNAAEGAVGLAQWEGGRRTALQSYARASGQQETALSAQLGYMGQELRASGLIPRLNAAGSPSAAATLWDTQYERSAGTTRAARISAANAIAGGSDPSATPLSLPGPAPAAPSSTGAGPLAADGITGTATKVALYVAIFATAGALVVAGLNKSTGGAIGKAAGHMPAVIPV